MAENQIHIDAISDRVFEVLADPASYAGWVVGTALATHDDSTEVLECEWPGRLLFLAHLGPIGSFRVGLVLQAEDGRTRVRMVEEPVEGISRFAAPLGHAVGRSKLVESLRFDSTVQDPAAEQAFSVSRSS